MRYISFSLWVDDPATAPKYLVGAVENVKLAKEIYPDWVCRFYVPFCATHDMENTIYMLEALGAQVVAGDHDLSPMYWRYRVADLPSVEYWIVRDADSRLSIREKLAVDQWIASGKILHSMRDHPAHCRGLNGGLIGAKGGALPHMGTLIRDWEKGLNRPFIYGDDQNFLGQVIWTRFHMHTMQHDSCCGYVDALPFPTRREGYRFVGEVYEADGTPRKNDWEQIVPNS